MEITQAAGSQIHRLFEQVQVSLNPFAKINETIKKVESFFSSGCFNPYFVKNSLLVVGAISLGIVFIGFYLPNMKIELPSWALGGFAACVAAVTFLGGACLWWNLDEKTKKSAEEIKKNLKAMQAEVGKLNKIITDQEKIRQEHERQVDRQARTTDALAIQVDKAAEVGEQFDRNVSELKENTALLDEVVTELQPLIDQMGSSQRGSTNPSQHHEDSAEVKDLRSAMNASKARQKKDGEN